MHLAQLNVARLRAPMEDPIIDDFRINLAPINALAEASPGYVWRLQDESGDATSIDPFGDELEIINLSVWESIDALADFTYRTGHVEFLRRRRDFFESPPAPSLCLWWIAEGTIPTVEDAVVRLMHLRLHGPTRTAFTFRHRFEANGSDENHLGVERDSCPACKRAAPMCQLWAARARRLPSCIACTRATGIAWPSAIRPGLNCWGSGIRAAHGSSSPRCCSAV